METSPPPTSFSDLEATINKWLLLNDLGIIKVLAATVLANRLKADPVWLFIVTASGGTKTELLRGLNTVPDIYPISDLTPQTFLSGEKSNKKASLLHRLPTEVIITMKDFTTVLTMHRDKRHAILSQLREIYDGQVRKEFGTGETKDWSGKIGFIAGVTSVIDHHYGVYQTLGERFIQYRPTQPDPIRLSLRALGNNGNENAMREEIQSAFANYIASVEIPVEPMDVSDELKRRIANLAAFCVTARSGIIRDGYSREIELVPEVELPTRLAKQFITLYCGLALISGEFTEADYCLIYKIAMDTIPRNRRVTIEHLVRADEPLETAGVAEAIHYPVNTTRRILEELHALSLVDRKPQGGSLSDLWSLRPKARGLLAEAQPNQMELVNQVFFDGKGIPEMSVANQEEIPMFEAPSKAITNERS